MTEQKDFGGVWGAGGGGALRGFGGSKCAMGSGCTMMAVPASHPMANL